MRGFIDRTDRVLALLDGFMPECGWLSDSATLTYLHSTVSTNRHRVRVPETPVYLDALLADQPVLVLDEPTAHLDHATAVELAQEVLTGPRERSVVWITHDVVGLHLADRVRDLGPRDPRPYDAAAEGAVGRD